nr:hypothetical protein [Desulfobacula sp.]
MQAVKAGILETGDVFIVNKSDRPDSEAAVFELNMMLGLRPPSKTGWKPLVLQTQALDGTGVKELARVFLSHFDFLQQGGRLEHRQRDLDAGYFRSLVRDLALEKITAALEASKGYQAALENIRRRETDPVTAAESVINKLEILHVD